MWVVDKYIQSAIIGMRICLKQHFPGENYEEISYYKGLSTDYADEADFETEIGKGRI
jgi:hypothetical protein